MATSDVRTIVLVGPDRSGRALARDIIFDDLGSSAEVIDGVVHQSDVAAAREVAQRSSIPLSVVWVEEPRSDAVTGAGDVDRIQVDAVVLNSGDVNDLRSRLTDVLKTDYRQAQTVRLFRGEAQKAKSGTKTAWAEAIQQCYESDPTYQASAKASGRWFGDSLQDALWYVNDAPEGLGRLRYLDLPLGVAEAYRVSKLPEVEGGKQTSENPKAFSARPEQEFFLPPDLAARAVSAPELPPWLNEETLSSFFHRVDRKYFDHEQGVWAEPFGTCTFLNSAPARQLFAAGFDVEICGLEEGTDAMRSDGLVAGGHDWLVVRKAGFEWIVDPWRVAYLESQTAITFDPAAIRQWYGPRHAWLRVSGVNQFEPNGWFGQHASTMLAEWDAHNPALRETSLTQAPADLPPALTSFEPEGAVASVHQLAQKVQIPTEMPLTR